MQSIATAERSGSIADDYLHASCLEEMLAVGEQSDTIGLVSAYRLYGAHLTNVGLTVDQSMRLLDNYDLGFAHCVFTLTGLHGARGETRSIYNGIVIREFMDFGFRKLNTYKSV